VLKLVAWIVNGSGKSCADRVVTGTTTAGTAGKVGCWIDEDKMGKIVVSRVPS